MPVMLAIAAALSAGITVALTPLVRLLALAIGAVDKPDGRKIHTKPMPRLGGLATFASFLITTFAVHFLFPQAALDSLPSLSSWPLLLASSLILLVLGMLDDIRPLKPGPKFLVQFLAAALVYFAGLRIESAADPFSGGVLSFGPLSLPLTVLWIVGVTNAFNLIDGLDGLASGIGAIAALTISAIALVHNEPATATLAITLAGVAIGFLRYNFNPAKVFLGDSGSLFLGFALAVLSIQSSAKGSTAFSVAVPLLALSVPIMDTSLAMLRRILRSFFPEQSRPATTLRKLHSMFQPDRRHIHHQLLARGLSQREAVFVLYFVSITFGLCAFLVTAGSLNASLILTGAGITAIIAIRKLGYRELALLRNGLLLRLYRRTLLRNAAGHVLLDVLSVAAAYLLASLLSLHARGETVNWQLKTSSLAVVAALQLSAFFVGGLYRRRITLFGIGDFLQILRAISVGTVATVFACLLLPLLQDRSNLGMLALLDYYFLATFVIGSRVAFHVMNYLFRRHATEGKKALIYGADRGGMFALQSLLAAAARREGDQPPLTPVGFLDDDPEMEGKFLDGYPVFGGHWKLAGLVKTMNVAEIVLAKPNITSATFLRLKKIADENRVPISISRVELEAVRRNGGPAETGNHSAIPEESNSGNGRGTPHYGGQ